MTTSITWMYCFLDVTWLKKYKMPGQKDSWSKNVLIIIYVTDIIWIPRTWHGGQILNQLARNINQDRGVQLSWVYLLPHLLVKVAGEHTGCEQRFHHFEATSEEPWGEREGGRGRGVGGKSCHPSSGCQFQLWAANSWRRSGVGPTLCLFNKVGQTPSGKLGNHYGSRSRTESTVEIRDGGPPQVAIKMRPGAFKYPPTNTQLHAASCIQ